MSRKKGKGLCPSRAEIDAGSVEATIEVQQVTYGAVTARARRVLARVCGLAHYGEATDEQVDTVFTPFKKRLMVREGVNPKLVD